MRGIEQADYLGKTAQMDHSAALRAVQDQRLYVSMSRTAQ
jgi:hypothetical protein